jgi:hypothetical protein
MKDHLLLGSPRFDNRQDHRTAATCRWRHTSGYVTCHRPEPAGCRESDGGGAGPGRPSSPLYRLVRPLVRRDLPRSRRPFPTGSDATGPATIPQPVAPTARHHRRRPGDPEPVTHPRAIRSVWRRGDSARARRTEREAGDGLDPGHSPQPRTSSRLSTPSPATSAAWKSCILASRYSSSDSLPSPSVSAAVKAASSIPSTSSGVR